MFRLNSLQQDALPVPSDISPLQQPVADSLLNYTIPPPTDFQDFIEDDNVVRLPGTPEKAVSDEVSQLHPYQVPNDTDDHGLQDTPRRNRSQSRPNGSSMTPDYISPMEQRMFKKVATSTPRHTQHSQVII